MLGEGLVPAEEVRKPYRYPCPKERVARECTIVEVGQTLGIVDFACENDRHNDAVDGYCLAKDNAE